MKNKLKTQKSFIKNMQNDLVCANKWLDYL